jgi:hypothetical protein
MSKTHHGMPTWLYQRGRTRHVPCFMRRASATRSQVQGRGHARGTRRANGRLRRQVLREARRAGEIRPQKKPHGTEPGEVRPYGKKNPRLLRERARDSKRRASPSLLSDATREREREREMQDACQGQLCRRTPPWLFQRGRKRHVACCKRRASATRSPDQGRGHDRGARRAHGKGRMLTGRSGPPLMTASDDCLAAPCRREAQEGKGNGSYQRDRRGEEPPRARLLAVASGTGLRPCRGAG